MDSSQCSSSSADARPTARVPLFGHGLPEDFDTLAQQLSEAPDDWPLRDRMLAVFVRDVIAKRGELERAPGVALGRSRHSRPSGTRSSKRSGVAPSNVSPGCFARQHRLHGQNRRSERSSTRPCPRHPPAAIAAAVTRSAPPIAESDVRGLPTGQPTPTHHRGHEPLAPASSGGGRHDRRRRTEPAAAALRRH
jgi:hypothetical protein